MNVMKSDFSILKILDVWCQEVAKNTFFGGRGNEEPSAGVDV
jgi:hypothetical protein